MADGFWKVGEDKLHYHVSFFGHSIYIFHVTLKKWLSFNTISLNIFDRVPVGGLFRPIFEVSRFGPGSFRPESIETIKV